jgi:glyoxylase-like metal-dependent hydrolase (beta-lactamase superfamily II)
MPQPSIHAFYHADTQTYSYLLISGQDAAIVDPVMDFNPASGAASFTFIDTLLASVPPTCRVRWILETHIHADHLSAAAYLRQKTSAQVVIGAHVDQVHAHFANLFQLEGDVQGFDQFVHEGDELPLGDSRIRVLETPGHTPACVSYVLDDLHVFVGDTFFMPDVGTARTDFPGGDAHSLYRSLQKLLKCSASAQFYMCHDYPPEGRAPKHQCPASAQQNNIHLQGHSEQSFIQIREARDQQLAPPRLILPSLQVNLRGGDLPKPQANGITYLLTPVNQLGHK